MLTCDICGEEKMLEEDMKTHLLLSHEENYMNCPLCSLAGVSYDELYLHICSAHPEKQQIKDPDSSTSLRSAETNTDMTEYEKPTSAQKLSKFSFTGERSDGECEEAPSGVLSVTTDGGATSGAMTQIAKPGQDSVNHSRLEDNNGIQSKHKAKQKRLSSPKEEKLFCCPVCAMICNSYLTLREHVELHLQEEVSAGGEKLFECPMCSVIYSDSSSLQEHVELHLEYESVGNSTGSPGSDLKLARQLQQEEEQRRRQEESQQEKEEFKKLQRQFGLDSGGGYRTQMQKAMERAVARGLIGPTEFHCKKAEMMESLASGVDDGTTRTCSVVQSLLDYYQTQRRDFVHVWLSADIDHYCSSAGDKGWGCGYRNLQMLLSSLHRIDTYSFLIQEKAVPSIPQVQRMIEEAWKEGIDPQGASHFNQRLQGTRAWIGATEIFSLLTSIGICARIIDFHQPTGPGDTHPQLFDWVKNYFSQSNRSSKLPPKIIPTSLPPLYLQHQGHSRTIVGLEQRKDGSRCLLLLDPSSSATDTSKLLSKDTVATAIRQVRKFPRSLKQKQYQVVAVQSVLTAEEKQVSISNSSTLCAERIP